MADDRSVCIKDLRPGMKSITSTFIVIDKGTTNSTKDGSVVRKCRVADKTGSIFFSLWNEQAEAIESGDILKLTKGYASVWKGSLVLYSGKYGLLEKIGEFSMLYSEVPDMSECAPMEQAQGGRAYVGGGCRTENPALPGSDTSQQQNPEPASKLRSPPMPEQPSYNGGSGGTMSLHPRYHNVSQPHMPPSLPPHPHVARQQHQQMPFRGLPPDHHNRMLQVPRPELRYHPYQRGRPMQSDGWM